VELNPVRAKLCRVPWRWRWSSAAAHVAGRDDGLVRVAPLLERVKDWREYLTEPLEAEEEQLWRRHERTGRPLGEPAFLDRIERLLGRIVRPAKRGPKPKRQ
jgi:putative transposase